MQIEKWLKRRLERRREKDYRRHFIDVPFEQLEIGAVFYAKPLGNQMFRKMEPHMAREATDDPGILGPGTLCFFDEDELGYPIYIWNGELGIDQGYCPDCGSKTFRHGPRGGLSENIRCDNCGVEFCFQYPFSSERIHRNDPWYYHETFELADMIRDYNVTYGLGPNAPKKRRIIPDILWAYSLGSIGIIGILTWTRDYKAALGNLIVFLFVLTLASLWRVLRRRQG